MMNIINKQLLTFYKSSTIFKFLLFKNKYILISFMVLGLITFLFNKNLNYFNDFTAYQLININLFTIKSIILLLVSFYLCYIKLNLLTRIFAIIKGIPFFYSEIKKNYVEDIRIICTFFYLFNFFLISISTLFIMNLSNNINLINSELGILIDYSTTILSLIILLFYFNRIMNKNFIINQNQINPLKVLFMIFIILTPFILLNLYADKINNLLGEYNIFKFSSIYSDSKGDTSFNNKLKEGTSVIITNNRNNSIHSHNITNSININTPTNSTSNFPDINFNASNYLYQPSAPAPSLSPLMGGEGTTPLLPLLHQGKGGPLWPGE
jgi:hypothetical protein